MTKTRRAGFRKKRRRGGRKTVKRRGGRRRSRVTKRRGGSAADARNSHATRQLRLGLPGDSERLQQRWAQGRAQGINCECP
jgi:hypothetical protein